MNLAQHTSHKDFLSTPGCVRQFVYWLQLRITKMKKKKRRKKLCVVMSNLTQDKHYSFFLDTAQFHHSSGEEKPIFFLKFCNNII